MGVTAASNMGALIVSGAAAADAVAILLGPDFPQAANGAVPAEADSTGDSCTAPSADGPETGNKRRSSRNADDSAAKKKKA
jgi:hypothetical protein